jgi:GT2 family glycosyltransferase
LSAGEKLQRCLRSLAGQTWQDFDVIVVDNSGGGLAEQFADPPRVWIIENSRNLGFGAAINQAVASTEAEFIVTLNDDAYPEAQWLAALLKGCESDPKIGMCASQIRLRPRPGHLDSAGLAIYRDGTTKQRGHGQPLEDFSRPEEVLLPSGCAALYRRVMLGQLGGFDADYFLYGEDADLGLRARLAGWRCLYVPDAVAEHDYSLSAGRASRLKAYYVERNRLYTIIKVFPLIWLLRTPWHSWRRYLAHLRGLARGEGLAAEFRQGGEKWWRLMLIVMSAHWGAVRGLPQLLQKRRLVQQKAVLDSGAFGRLLARYELTAREVARQ